MGEAGRAEFQREMTPSIAGVPEVGWVLSPQFHGKGYGTEAVRAACAWGDGRFDDVVNSTAPAPAKRRAKRAPAKATRASRAA